MNSNIPEYIPGRFSDVYSTELGEQLWAFLNEPSTLTAMEVASDLAKPAVAGIEEPLLNRFRDQVLDDRVKQAIGHMVRQVMEHLGYIIYQNNVTIRSVPFTKGTRYRKPEWQYLHVYRNTADYRDVCFTDRRSADKLPELSRPATWRYSNSFATKLRAYIGYGLNPDDALAEIHAQGYYRHAVPRLMKAGNN